MSAISPIAPEDPQHERGRMPGEQAVELHPVRILALVRPTPPSRSHGAASTPDDPTLDLEFALPSGVPSTPRNPLRLVHAPPVPIRPGTALGVDDFSDRIRTSTSDLPEPTKWAARISQAIAEVNAGVRPPHQLTRWATHALLTKLRKAHAHASRERAPRAVRLRGIHVGQPADGVIEASALIARDQRIRALALRFEGWDGRWLCVSADLI